VLATAHLPVARLGLLPGNVIARQWFRQRQLVHRADVFVTHAGMSSVHEAILAGTPMLLTPRSREQRRTATRLCALGVATMMDRPESLRAQADRLASDPALHARLAAVRARATAAGGPGPAADLLWAAV